MIKHFFDICRVLIDTWWNVNVSADTTKQVTYPVLIDTWWNVNTESICKWFGIQPRFNRYMVECESFKCDLNRTTGMGFNRYMVECECNRNG